MEGYQRVQATGSRAGDTPLLLTIDRRLRVGDLYVTDLRFAVHFDEVAPGVEQAPEDDDRTGANLPLNLAACGAGRLAVQATMGVGARLSLMTGRLLPSALRTPAGSGVADPVGPNTQCAR